MKFASDPDLPFLAKLLLLLTPNAICLCEALIESSGLIAFLSLMMTFFTDSLTFGVSFSLFISQTSFLRLRVPFTNPSIFLM